MRVVIHDYAGHPPQVYLSRALARKGHDVLHLYAGGIETPRGGLIRKADDPETFAIEAINIRGKFQKHNYLVRQIQEWQYGRSLVRRAMAYDPDVVVCSNTPLAPLWRLQQGCRSRDVPFLFWLMDVYSVAVSNTIRAKLPVIGHAISAFYNWLEGYELRRSDKVVLISEGFRPTAEQWGVPGDELSVMPLWSALAEIPVMEKDNAWARRHGFAETINLIYAGTLGAKHNPEMLVELALAMRASPSIRVITISEGLGANFLKQQKRIHDLENLIVLPYQPFEDLPLVLGSADVLLALLEPAAGAFSTPGKVLTHLCAGRPQVAAVPQSNRAWQVIHDSGGGLVCQPGDITGFVSAVRSLVEDPAKRADLGRNVRAYAEREFDIDRLATEFQVFIRSAIANRAKGRVSH